MRRLTLTALAALLLLLGSAAMPVSAGKGWCRSDPTVSVNGVSLQFWISIPLDNQADVVGPIAIVFLAPRASNATLVASDPGFNGYGESIQLVGNGTRIAPDGSFPVGISVSVPMRGNQVVPMEVEVIPASGDSVVVDGDATGVAVTLTLPGPTVS
jgi:hypothetical protein